MTLTKTTLVIDTDPGVDDILALLLALNSPSIDLKLISLCFGNCNTHESLRNVLSMFYVIQKELETKRASASNLNYANQKPTVAVGLPTSLEGEQLDATYYHGKDGLGNVHTLAPEYTCPQEWIDLFSKDQQNIVDTSSLLFKPSTEPSYMEILRILKEEPENSVVICAIGPQMNIAKAAELDWQTFSRVKKVVSMGGALNVPGNVTPVAEFNIYADSWAASKVFDYTSLRYDTPLELVLLPLDITDRHELSEKELTTIVQQAIDEGSPLAAWMSVWLNTTLEASRKRVTAGVEVALPLHDPLTIWYVLQEASKENWTVETGLDLRVETKGVLTKGFIVQDKRHLQMSKVPLEQDTCNWQLEGYGNRVTVAFDSKYKQTFGVELVNHILH